MIMPPRIGGLGLLRLMTALNTLFIALLAVLVVIGIMVNGVRAREGARARELQCLRQPVTNRLYEAAARGGLISGDDLATFKRTSPNC